MTRRPAQPRQGQHVFDTLRIPGEPSLDCCLGLNSDAACNTGPRSDWSLQTDLRVQGLPSLSASSGSTVKMLPVLKPRCRSSTQWRQMRSKAARSTVLLGCSGCTPACKQGLTE